MEGVPRLFRIAFRIQSQVEAPVEFVQIYRCMQATMKKPPDIMSVASAIPHNSLNLTGDMQLLVR
jgi:hypothetical protein